MLSVHVRPHARRHLQRRLPAHPSKRVSPKARTREQAYTRSRPSLEKIINDVRQGRRAGYTYTGGWFFDIDDPKSMDAVYDRLGEHAFWVIGRTTRTLAEFERSGKQADIGYNFGVSTWKDASGTIYLDDIAIFDDRDGFDDERALVNARDYNQFVILKVDGRTRSFAFLEGPGYDVAIHGQGAERTFEPRPEK